jgi:hypothetical protein
MARSLAQAKEGKDAIVTGGPYALLRCGLICVETETRKNGFV